MTVLPMTTGVAADAAVEDEGPASADAGAGLASLGASDMLLGRGNESVDPGAGEG